MLQGLDAVILIFSESDGGRVSCIENAVPGFLSVVLSRLCRIEIALPGFLSIVLSILCRPGYGRGGLEFGAYVPYCFFAVLCRLGYGKKGSPPEIPPDATLVFHVTLLSISK